MVCRAQEGLSRPPHKVDPRAQKVPWIGQKTPKIPQKTTFCHDRQPNSCYTDKQPLYFHHMILIKILRLKRGWSKNNVALGPQKPPELSEKHPTSPQNITCCSGRGPGSCHIGIQPLYFHLMTLNKELKKVISDHKLAFQPPLKRHQLSKKHQHHPKTFAALAWEPDNLYRCYIKFQSCHFGLLTLGMVCRAQEGVSRPQGGSKTTKVPWIGQN